MIRDEDVQEGSFEQSFQVGGSQVPISEPSDETLNDPKPMPRTEGDRSKQILPRERFHFGTPQAKLTVHHRDPNYHYYWVNDYPGRLEQALSGGWQFVLKQEVSLLPGVVPRDSDLGSRVSAIVGRTESAEPLRAYLMKLPLEMARETWDVRNTHNKRILDSIKMGRPAGTDQHKFYVPQGTPIKMETELVTHRKDES